MKPSRKKLRTMLEAIGAGPVPAPNPEFVANLEQRLLGLAPDTVAPLLEREDLRRARRSRLVLLPAAALIAAVLMTGAVIGVVDGGNSGSPARRLELSAAKDTVVELPDGSEVEGEPGLELPDGAVVRTGPNGSATFGDVDLGPGEVATIDNGEVVVTPPPTTVPTLPITLPPVTVPPVTLPPGTSPGLPGT